MIPGSDFFRTVYSNFCSVRDGRHHVDELPILDYESFKFDDGVPFRGILRTIFLRQSENFAREILNEIHNVRRFLEDLRCWRKVLQPYSEEERFYLLVEFVEERTVLALGRPAAIKGRFIYAATKLGQLKSHLAKLPTERQIDFAEMKKWISGWRLYPEFSVCLTKLDGQAFRVASRLFRDFDAHRFPPRIEIGLAPAEGIFTRDGKITYAANHHEPLSLESVDGVLAAQYPVMAEALEVFWQMVVAKTEASDPREMAGRNRN